MPVIRESFATIAREFGPTRENCPTHTSFIELDKLRDRFNKCTIMFGYFLDGRIIGFVSLTKSGETSFELNNLAVLPECRHKGYGRELLDFCKSRVRELGESNRHTVHITG